MRDFYGQTIGYIHESNEIIYVAKSITQSIDDTLFNIVFDS